ncbi:F-box only protein 30-like isoform X1 [Hypomesus transpacificus]|uniref:F-box only protein 30-like isoform X1 n=2 Tax=Hypomesus transpacificus TaxID=137520 RepID=UPI001F075E33|nr:F-box only protein 30-like isoform X1 [Hypomesus transpacificus]
MGHLRQSSFVIYDATRLESLRWSHHLNTSLPLTMEQQHAHCVTCVSQRCMTRPERGVSCDLVTCSLVCGASFHACKGSEHRLLCPLERVPCLNSGFGCPATLIRHRMPAHLQVCPAGVVCCTMEWNRWPVSCLDYTSYESLSRGVEEVEQLDMALALQDQRTLLESLKVVAMAPTIERSPPVAESKRNSLSDSVKPAATSVACPPMASTTEPCSSLALPPVLPPTSAKDKIANGINGLNEEQYSKLYEATVETARSLAAALDVLSSASTSDNNQLECVNEASVVPHSEGSDGAVELSNGLESKAPVTEGVGVKECYGQLHQATVQLRRSLVSALGVLGNTVKDTDPINRALSDLRVEPSCSSHQSKPVDPTDVDVKDGMAGLIPAVSGAVSHAAVVEATDRLPELSGQAMELSTEVRDKQSLCNGCLDGKRTENGAECHASDAADNPQEGPSGSSLEPICSAAVQDRVHSVLAPPLPSAPRQEPTPHSVLPLAPPLQVQQEIAQRAGHVVLEDRGTERKFQNHQLLRGLGQYTLCNGRRTLFSDRSLYRYRPKMEDKAVDTSDLEQEEDPMGLGEIDLITAALLFCLEESRECRRISDTVYVDGFHVDFGTQTFTFPAAILVTSTRVGDVASASACDHAAPQLSYPSPFRTLRLDLVLEEVPQIRNIPSNRFQHMFSFVCGQLFRRDEYSSHFKNVHEDIHAGLNGWMEHRCPLAYYGCTYSQRRLCPSTQGSKVIHDRNLRSFGVQPGPDDEHVNVSQVDQFSGLPFEILRHVAGFLDGFSLCQLSMVSRTMRDVCSSLLQSRGIVELRWERKHYPNANGSFSWQIKDRVWRFSTAFSPVSEWRFAKVPSMSDHLGKCRYNTVERKSEAFPLPSMCTARPCPVHGRGLLEILKLHQEQHLT